MKMRTTKKLILALTLAYVLSVCSTPGHAIDSTGDYFPVLEVSGSYYEIGHKVGSTFKINIQVISKRYQRIFEFVEQDDKNNLKACQRITEKHFPEIMEELRGMADGAEMSFDRLFAMNMRAEIDALKAQTKEENPGCSDIHLVTKNNTYLLHNEDGPLAAVGNMYVVKVTTPKGVTFAGLSYPGIALGNGPGINSAGIMQTNNAIEGHRYKKGVPRTIINRAMMETTSLDDAIKMVTHPARANSYHHNIGSVKKQQLLSVEVIPDQYTIHETKKTYVHTNHMILQNTCHLPCDEYYKKKSSIPRRETITKYLAKHTDAQITMALCLETLSSHSGKPYSPCRHPLGDVTGKTLATAVFDFKAGKMTLYRGNPCTSVKAANCNTFVYNKLQ
jgi:predicted choloylglycine hydrolase